MKIFKKLDDELHFWAGAIISTLAFIPLTLIFSQWLAAIFAFGITASAAIGKEWYDQNIKKTMFDERDLKWTVIGGSIVPIIFIIADILYYYS